MNKKNNKRVMITAGGTGGHIFSGLSVARCLIAKGYEICWLGANNHMEKDLIPKYGIIANFICVNGLCNKKIKEQLLAIIRFCYAFYKARKIIYDWYPNVVLSMGGYVSGPGSIAAWSYGIPIILHEQNCIAGLTNRYLSKIAHKVLQAFPGAFPNAKTIGNPIRDEILTVPIPEIRLSNRNGPIRVLIIGGSQGAEILNNIIPIVAAKLTGMLTLWHQVGKGALSKVNKLYSSINETQHNIVEFIDDMSIAYSWADLIICRSGALTVSEIAVVGLPALFVPFEHKDKQQYLNALLLEKIGAAKIIKQSEFTVNNVKEILIKWNRQILFIMATRARKIAILDAAEHIAQEVISV